jgi:hypothetical protein
MTNLNNKLYIIKKTLEEEKIYMENMTFKLKKIKKHYNISQKDFVEFVLNNELITIKEILDENIVNENLNFCFNAGILSAAENGLTDMVVLFLDYYKYNHYIDRKTNPIEAAIKGGHIHITKLILDRTTLRGDENRSHSIHLASKLGHFDIVEFLLSKTYSNPSDKENLAIRNAAKNGHINIVKLLLNDSRVDPSDHYNLAILLAYDNNHENVIELLWNNEQVKNSLKEDEIDVYHKLIKFDIKNKVNNF